MTSTLLFIHGTGVRQPGLAASMKLLEAQAAEFLPGWKIEPCPWGDAFGAALNKHGASVPSYVRTGNPTASLDAQQRARWTLLADDPLIELRVAPDETYLLEQPGPVIWVRIARLRDHAPIEALLSNTGLPAQWAPFIDTVLADVEWQTVVSALTLSEAAASPLVARALVAGLQARLRELNLPTLAVATRDALADALLPPLGGPPAGITDWLLGRMTAYGRRRRGSLTDLTSPVVGDILRYQARGSTLRDFIGLNVQNTGARVLLAHSLGGIAAVDWLALERRPIDVLITVGSQAAFFYEIDALASRVLGSGLPDFFPERWLNIYDENDMLGYPAAGVFKGKVLDLPVDNGAPFPEAHGAYFGNRAQVWPAIADFLKGG
ncbi:hypothetical protein H6CHR_00137 [Variovorax sp. PBL-H6]|uniref:hypothetical protein n=1 Tax=Variovorax sp. PBL-H6 TaxID=434009 RepID=UPI001317C489|nr:hypothetical protein [Variovorax sp. PBL-H6]VTU15155.1 hypothetical protein H6CHR_00137 [Variovorax sp. PBL-H6]